MNTLIASRIRRTALLAGLGASLQFGILFVSAAPADVRTEVKNLSINGGLEDGKARLVIEALLNRSPGEREKMLYATTEQHVIKALADRLEHSFSLTFDILQGDPAELTLKIEGPGEIRQVDGEALKDWSVRQETNAQRVLVLRPRKVDSASPTQLAVKVLAVQEIKGAAMPVMPLTLVPTQPALLNGYVRVDATSDLDVKAGELSGLVPIESKLLPQSMRAETKGESEPLTFRFQGSAYTLPLELSLADPEARRVVLRDFKLTGQMSDEKAEFTLTATAQVKNSQGSSLSLLAGGVALTEVESHSDWRVKLDRDQFVLTFDHPGQFPVRLRFNAAVKPSDGWNEINFRVAPSALQPVTLQGLAGDTRFQFAGAARPERVGAEFVSYLPPTGLVNLRWKEARAEAEGKLFYAGEMLSQITVSPGLMVQAALLDFKVMQGELNRVGLLLQGGAEVTRVQGDHVLSWQVLPGGAAGERRLLVQLNQPQQDRFGLQLQMQTPLGAFPQVAEATQLRPEGATRFAGYFRVVNEGAVRLEITQAAGLSQISPEQFPESAMTKVLFRASGAQRFAYRFSGSDVGLRIQADQILPELSVSQVSDYHLGENELSIDTELELDVREAPLRELVLRVPKGYALARLSTAGLSDYFLTETPNESDAELRLVYTQPLSGRQVMQIRFERNQALGALSWTLPRLDVPRAKSVRGQVGVSADPGFRLTPERTQALTEMATAFFPKKVTGLQTAFRLSDPAWQAAFRVERLPQTVQADVLHLFSIGEGVAYGSSVISYLVSGAPVSAFRVELSSEYSNVEFTGKDIRNWQKVTNGYVVQLHTPISGAFTLLASYERPFKPQGETLAFSGARPLDAQSEQGHTLVVSAYQFQVQPAEVSPGLLPLEAAEVPPEYRLFFDAPVLGAYRYTSRPFNLRLALSPLAQGDSLSQVVDRASLRTRISRAGQVLTDVRYFVKNRGHPHFRVAIPEGTQLWSATVNGVAVVPVTDAKDNLIPLPQRADPNAVLTIDLKLAARSSRPQRVTVTAPTVAAPVMLAEWKIEPDTGQRLVYRGGSLTPVRGEPDVSGFAGLVRLFTGTEVGRAWSLALAAVLLIGLAVLVWHWTARDDVYRFSARHLLGLGLGSIAFGMGLIALLTLTRFGEPVGPTAARELTFLAPVQQANSGGVVEVGNVEEKASVWGWIGQGWPAVLALAFFLYGIVVAPSWFRSGGWLLGWVLVGWAALRWPDGLPAFLVVLIAFLIVHVLWPALRRLGRLPAKPKQTGLSSQGPAAATALILLGGFLWSSTGTPALAADEGKHPPAAQTAEETRTDGVANALAESTLTARTPALPASVTQQIQVEEKFALGKTKIRWEATKGQLLPLVFEPAVLTRVSYPTNTLKLVAGVESGRKAVRLLALETGAAEIELEYEVEVSKRDSENGFVLPTAPGLINSVQLTLLNLDVDVVSSSAVSIQREVRDGKTTARLVLAPVRDAWLGWRPRSRDIKGEKAVFYAELHQLYVPSAGVDEGIHYVALRPAQGELSELVMNVPAGTSITDVLDASRLAPIAATNAPPAPAAVSLWRFDPDTRKLRVTLHPPQSRPFALVVRSQLSTGPLPAEQAVGLLSVDGAAGEIGLLGLATGKEVQLDTVTADRLSPINLEDFPGAIWQAVQGQSAELTLRRAYRYADSTARAVVKASAVEPDIRVETQDTLSLGEDRVVLAVKPSVSVTRAGIFKLSFVLPTGLDVESVSGDALSHWTESRTDTGRVITLHLRGKTEGDQQFAISLAGPGLKSALGWVVPQVVFREASKQRGSLLVVPEQGMRLQVAARESLTQLDPQKAGIRQKGVLAFRVLQTPSRLVLDIEQVDPWIQVTSLQHATVSEALVKVAANLQYQIENTGIKSLRMLVPADAESVRFQGDQLADFRPTTGAVTNGLQQWEIKLHRRVIGQYLLRVSYQTRMAEQATNTSVRGLQALDINLQRGFVTVQAGGRLQVRVDAPPPSLQPTEWQSIPRVLQQDLATASANFAFRLIDPSFQLPLKVDRHPAAKLLAARVNNIVFKSVISDDGAMLTQVRMEMFPGDKRLLHLTLPKEARFWFAFVNHNGVWPWREQDQILIPMEPQSRSGEAVPVEFFYSSQIGEASGRALDLELLAPKFDLPLENITWQVYLNDKWHLKKWAGSLQLEERQVAVSAPVGDLQTYLQNEANVQRQNTKEAEQMLAFGNSALEQGDPEHARRAFQAAFGLSQGDQAFNEDARVQLNNLKVQQALVGLNVRQAAVAGDSEALAGKLRELRERKNVAYTQQDAKAIIDRHTAEENAALVRLAQRLIQQQEAAVSSPAAIRASIPEQGQVLTFKRAVLVDTWADLRIRLAASAVQVASWKVRVLILVSTLILFAAFAWAARGFNRAAHPRW